MENNIAKIIEFIKALPFPLVISVANQKGGVGKTASTDNIGEDFADLGLKVDLMDIDPQSSLTNLKIDMSDLITSGRPEMANVMKEDIRLEDIRLQLKENLSLYPTSLKLSDTELLLANFTLRELILKKQIESLNHKPDIILIDCPPSRGLLTVNALSASNYILIPVQSEYQALLSIELLFNTITNVKKQINPDLKELGYVITMATKTNHSDEVIEEIENDDRTEVIGKISRGIAVSDAGVAGTSTYQYDRSSTPGIQYRNLAKTILKKIYNDLVEGGNNNG